MTECAVLFSSRQNGGRRRVVRTFHDSESDDEFIGFIDADLEEDRQRSEARESEMARASAEDVDESEVDEDEEETVIERGGVPDGCSHAWLPQFLGDTGLQHVPDDISACELFQCFMTDAVFDLDLCVRDTRSYYSIQGRLYPRTPPAVDALCQILRLLRTC